LIAIFVQPPSLEILESRLRQRQTESESALKQRIEKAAYELSFAPEFDYVLVNNDLDLAKQEVLELVKDFIA
jgi:guanylate kinase